jgi:hypothetical protein
MNFTQIQDRLRLELLRRIQRGSLSVSLLARQTGFGQAHVSNFLRFRRQLSLDGMDRFLAAQQLAVADLLPAIPQPAGWPESADVHLIPVVSHAVALFEQIIRSSVAHWTLRVPSSTLRSIQSRPSSNSRQTWDRFVAVRVTQADAAPMEPLVLPDAVAIIDRHYNSLVAYRPGRANLYAVRHGAHLTLRYADFLSNRLVLRPFNIAFPVELIELGPGEGPSDPVAGRVVMILNEL